MSTVEKFLFKNIELQCCSNTVNQYIYLYIYIFIFFSRQLFAGNFECLQETISLCMCLCLIIYIIVSLLIWKQTHPPVLMSYFVLLLSLTQWVKIYVGIWWSHAIFSVWQGKNLLLLYWVQFSCLMDCAFPTEAIYGKPSQTGRVTLFALENDCQLNMTFLSQLGRDVELARKQSNHTLVNAKERKRNKHYYNEQTINIQVSGLRFQNRIKILN